MGKKINTRFTFTGILHFNPIDSNRPYLRTGKTKTGAEYKSISFGVESDNNNRAYVEIFGSKQSEIKTIDVAGKSVTVTWSNRNNPDIVKDVASYKKFVFKLGSERKEFIAELDFIEFIEEHLDELNGKRFVVTGTVKKNVYNGQITDRFSVESIYEPTENSKDGLFVKEEFFFNKESLDDKYWKDEKKIIFNGYTREYIDSDNKDVYVGQTVVVDCSHLDLDNQKILNRLRAKLIGLGCDIVDGKVKCEFKKSNYYSMQLRLTYVNGNEVVEFDESMLTPFQKKMLELDDSKTVDDFRPSSQIYGNRVREYRLKDVECKGEIFADGPRDTEVRPSEFEDNIYHVPEKEEEQDVDFSEGAMNPPVSDDDEDDDELF